MSGPGRVGCPDAERLATRLVQAGGGSVRAVLLYGSRLLGATPDRHSALDFVVLVDDYRRFYEGLGAARELHRPVWLMASLARVLPPNVVAFAPDEGRGGIAKCLVVSEPHFERALGPRPPDHLLLGRMVQRVGFVRTADAHADAWVRDRLDAAREGVLSWMAPYLAGDFDALELGRRMLEVCYKGELRPEAGDRAEHVFKAQVDHFRATLGPVLERAAAAGVLRRTGERYERAEPVSGAVRRRWRRHFRRSKVRATARWLKHTVTFASWLPYVVRKVERRTGRSVELTALERKLPLVFLWPRAIAVLLRRPEREAEPAGQGPEGSPKAPARGSAHPEREHEP